jgi:hypothetical protein
VGQPIGGRTDDKPTGGDVKNLMKDKRFLGALGVVSVLGLVVFLRRGDSQAGIGGDPTAKSGGYVQGYADTTGTDIASFLGSYTTSLNAQNAAFLQTLTDTLSKWKGDTPGDVDDPPPFSIQPIPNFRNTSPTRNGGPWWSDQQQLSWDKVAGAVGYKITELGTTGLSYTVGDVNSYWFNGLIPQGSYHWKIEAKDAAGKVIGSSTLYNTTTAK